MKVILSSRPLQAVLLATAMFCAGVAAADSRQQMLKRLEQLDRLDRADFLDGLDEAGQCTAKRNFSCAEASLQRIKPLARSTDDERLFALASNGLQREKNQVAQEERAQREEEERAEREERRLIAEEERAQRAAAEEEKRRALQYGLNSMAIAMGGKNLRPEQLNTLMEANKRDYEQGGNGSNLQSSLNKMKADNERRLQESQQQIRAQQVQRQREQEELRQATARQRASVQPAVNSAATSAGAVTTASATALAASRRQEEMARQERAEQQLLERKNQEAAAAVAEQERQKKLAQEKADREARLAAEKAEREAKKVAEKAAADRARQEYLQAMSTGITLRARTCPGPGYYIVGIRPRIKPEVVSCIDIRYGTRCPGERSYTEGVGKNFLGASTDCFMGDTYEVLPRPACPADQVEVKVISVEGCGR